MVASRIEQDKLHRSVAIGDSTTESINDPDSLSGQPDRPDRQAVRLGAINPELEYANLAVRGRYAAQVGAEQLPSAREQRPDLASVIAGVNDLLRPRCDIAELIGHLDHMYGAPRDVGATVLTITQPTPVVVT